MPKRRMKTGFKPLALLATISALLLASTTSCYLIEKILVDEPEEFVLYSYIDPPDKGNTVNLYYAEYINAEGELVTAGTSELRGGVGVLDRIPLWVNKITLEAVPGPGYRFDHWSPGNETEEFTDINVRPDDSLTIHAYFVPIPAGSTEGPSDWETPEGTPELGASITPRVEVIEGPTGCIDSIIYADYEASAYSEHYLNFLQLKKDGEEWLSWQGDPTAYLEDETQIEVPCSGGAFLELYATNTNGDEISVNKEVLIPHTVSSLTWDVDEVAGEECRMELKLDFWGRDNYGPNKKLSSLVLTANTETWYNQQLSTDYHEDSITRVVNCGEVYSINLTATDVDGNKYTWRETIEIPTPEPEEEPPPQDAPPAHETLYVAFALSGQCTSSESGCTCTVSYSVDAEDRSAGDKYPVTNVIFEVNDGTGWEVWHNSNAISTPAYHHADQETGVDCDKTFNVRVTATNSIGQTVTSTGSFTTASP
jgi:hypothetical protein